ncbi:uncharacterized protein LOC117170918 [Belonocnema kinseyi]|uniref:uncharacterized protein LOC117170918 n=1 Tax=Belonocnema kinseyi TaxID=2817044 RepID=UPI00143D1F21|nr:uncharacterized protein LOC117170918 [Belonocnema kinseyi]
MICHVRCVRNFITCINAKTFNQRSGDGRFIVKSPFRADVSLLRDSKLIAQKRFLSVERELLADPKRHVLHKNFMKEGMELGHLFPVSDDHPNKFLNYLPHHGVLKASSSSKKLRMVYDASSKTSSGISLNDILQVGPTIQQDLFSILARFRQHSYVVTADIRKMYPQVMLDANDQDLQYILWRDDPSRPIQSFRSRRFTF